MTSTNTLISHIVGHLLTLKGHRPILVAFDGVDTSGKTTLANSVHHDLQSQAINSVRVCIDNFHHPRAVRVSKGEYSPEGFFYDSFDYAKVMDGVINPVKQGKSTITNGISDAKLTQDSIVLFDGIFMHRDALYPYWDYSVFLDVSFDTVRKRALDRDKALFGSAEEVLNKYNARYIPGEEIYLALCKPRRRAKLVVDNNDWLNPIITQDRFRRPLNTRAIAPE